MLKLSIIIPVYNGEKYISSLIKNLNIVINDDIEVIFVENGSKDNTYNLLKEYSKNKSNIKVYQSEKGVSKARNYGIKKSTGKYIMFVDADDKLLENSIKTILKDINSNDDLYIYSFIKGKEQEDNDHCKKIILDYKNNNKLDVLKWTMQKPTLRATAWGKVYKKDVLIKYNFFFNEDLRYSEDSEFLLRYLKNISKIKVSNECIYKYVLSPESSMRSNVDGRINQYLKAINCSFEEFKNTEYENFLYLYILTQLNIIMVHDIFIYKKNINFSKDVKKFKKIYNNSIFKLSLKNTHLKYFCNKELSVEFFLKIKLNFIAYLLCYLKSYLNQK